VLRRSVSEGEVTQSSGRGVLKPSVQNAFHHVVNFWCTVKAARIETVQIFCLAIFVSGHARDWKLCRNIETSRNIRPTKKN